MSIFNNKRLGLVLGGGGARGGAHIGAMAALHDLGFQPDVIVGTSAGGIAAALLGIGWTPQQMADYFTTHDRELGEIVTVDRSGRGLIGLDRLEQRLRSIFGDADLRDLSPQVAVMTTDVCNFDRVLIEGGPVVKALMATISIPGLFPYVEWDGCHLVDGGLCDNVPTQAAYELGADRIIAVDIGLDITGEADINFDDVNGLTKQVGRALYWLLSLSKRQQAFDTINNAMRYSLDLLVQYHLSMYPPDVLIRPDMPDVSTFDIHKMQQAIDAGYRDTMAAEDEIITLMNRWTRPKHEPRRLSALTHLG